MYIFRLLLNLYSMTLTRYYIKSNIDTKHFVRRFNNLLVPTPERAIVDNITCEKHARNDDDYSMG